MSSMSADQTYLKKKLHLYYIYAYVFSSPINKVQLFYLHYVGSYRQSSMTCAQVTYSLTPSYETDLSIWILIFKETRAYCHRKMVVFRSKNSELNLGKCFSVAGKVSQWLRTSILAEEQSSAPSTHVAWLTKSSGGLIFSSGLHG